MTDTVRRLVIPFVLCSVLLVPASARNGDPVPPAYQDLYSELESRVAAFNALLDTGWDGATWPVRFGSHVEAANSSNAHLLDPGYYDSVILPEIYALKAMGARVVTVNVGFPLLYPDFFDDPAEYEQYRLFYRRVADDIRAAGLELVVISHFVLAEEKPEVTAFYAGLTIEQYRLARARQVLTIAQEMRPDYLSVITEPDMEARKTGQPVSGPQSAALLLDAALNELQQAGITDVAVGAGIGNWTDDYLSYVDSFALRSIQYIDIHVYTANKDFLPRTLQIADAIISRGKTVAISEAWLNKERDSELGTVPQAVAKARNAFSFWAPLDTDYLHTVVKLSHYKHVAFMTAFWSSNFFTYLTHTDEMESLEAADIYDLFGDASEEALAAAQSSSTGRAYAAMITDPPDVTAPTTPGELTAANYCAAGVSLSWIPSTDNIGVHGYQVFRNGLAVGTTIGTTFVDVQLPAATHEYTVAAYDFPGNSSAPSTSASAATAEDAVAPQPPANLTAQIISPAEVLLSWEAASDDVCVAGYRIYRDGIEIGAATDTSFEDDDIAPAMSYAYTVAAYDVGGNLSGLSTALVVTTPADITPPTTPLSLSVALLPLPTIGLYVAWVPSADDVAVYGYRLQRDGVQIADIRGLKYLDTNLAPATMYSYIVSAYDAAGNVSPPSVTTTATTSSDTVPPAAPTGLAAAPVSPSQIDLAWSPAVDNVAVTGYRVYRDGAEVGNVAGTVFSDRMLASATTYSYTVAAYDAAGNLSLQSPAVAGTTPVAAPSFVFEISAVKDLTYNGVAATDVAGRDVAVGDVNNDGIADLIIGARQTDPSGKMDAGSVYIYFGPIGGSGTIEISAGANATIHGVQAGDQSGIGVATGDVNDDGIVDLLVGARYASPGGRMQAGQGYVVFGPIAGGVHELADVADVIVNGTAAGNETGVGVAAGDLNGDGRSDFVIGARHADPNGVTDAGEAYVIYGPLMPGTYELTDAADVVIQGIETDEKFGYGLGTGDVNGDGSRDLIAGAFSNDSNGALDAGRAYIFFGPLTGGVFAAPSANIMINGELPEDHLGVDAELGDTNGDGIADILLGASEADPAGRDKAGRAYVVNGPLAAGTYNLASLPRTVFNGAAPTDYFGIGLSAGDLNNDRLPDTVVAAFRADPSSSRVNAGQVYVVFGKCSGRLPTISGTPGDDAIEGTAGDDVIVGLLGNDSIFGLAGNDVVCGGPGNDVLFGNQGDDMLVGGPGGDQLMCGPGSDTANGGGGTDSASSDCEVKQSIP